MKENKGPNREIDAIGSRKAGTLLLVRRAQETMLVRLRAESPAIISTGQRPVERGCSQKLSPERAKSSYLIRCRPFRAMETGLPLFTGRCPVLLIAGLSALRPKTMVRRLRRANEIGSNIYAENTTN
jgi:hypothetical protein